MSKFSQMSKSFLYAGVFLLNTFSGVEAKEPYKVAITQIIQHPSLDLIRKGIVDELKEQGFEEGKNLEILFDEAQGNIPRTIQIAQGFVAEKPDVCVAIATPSAQAMVKAAYAEKLPVVFGAVTDPVGAGIVKDLAQPTPGVTGTVDLPPVEDQLKLILKLIPKVQKVGIVYNPGESNNVSQVALVKKAAEKYKIQILESTATKTTEVMDAALHLVGEVQAFLILNDNTVVAGLEAVLNVANENSLPVFTSDPESVERGALAAVANDQHKVGRETGKLVAEVLKGTSLDQLPIKKVSLGQVYINPKVAQKLSLKIPEEYLEKKQPKRKDKKD